MLIDCTPFSPKHRASGNIERTPGVCLM